MALVDPLADPLRVGEGAQVVDPVKLGARHVQTAGHGAGGHQKAVIAQALVPFQPELLAGSASMPLTRVEVHSSISFSA